MSNPKVPHEPTAQIVWFDPGQTTGVAVLAIRPGWLAGDGDADWVGLRKAIKTDWFAQVGYDARQWDERTRKAVGVKLVDRLPEKLFCGVPPDPVLANELDQIFQLREILDLWPAAAWGYEDYIPESMAAAQRDALTPVRIFAPLRFGMIMDDARPRAPFVQGRAMKYTANDDRMKAAGLYLPGMPHATDAARHAAVFARAARQKPKLRALAWPRLFGRNGRYAAA